jgi:hypothetical protein
MFENDARPNMADPVGQAPRGLALAVRNEVAAAGGAQLRVRARATRGRRRIRISVPALSITAAAVVAAALLVIVLGPFGAGHRPAITTPNVPAHSRLASHSSRVGGVTFVSYNLNQVVTQAPTMTVHSSTIKYPDLDANRDAIAFGAGSTWVLESAKPLGGPAKPIGSSAASDCGALVRLNSSTMAATGTLPTALCPTAVAFGDGSVWVLSFQIGVNGYRLTRVDPINLAVRSSTIIDGGAGGVAPQGDTGAKYVYVTAAGATVEVAVQTGTGTSQIVTLNARTLATVGSVTIPEPHGLAAALADNSGTAWLGTTAGWLYRIDPHTGSVTSERQLGASVLSLSASDRAIWMTIALPPGKPASAYPGFDTLELNPVTGAVEHDTGLPLLLAATDRSDVWGIFSTPQHGNYIARIDPSTRTVAGATSSPFEAPAYTPDTIGVSNGAAWIINTNLQTLTKVVPVR